MEDQILMDNAFGNTQMSDRMKSILADIAKWAKFLAIIGFIFIGLMVLGSLFAGAVISMMMPEGMVPAEMYAGVIIYLLVISGIYFFPVLFLYQFASGAQRALATGNDTEIEKAFNALRKHYRFLGILTIVFLAIYVIWIAFMIAVGAAYNMPS